MLTHKEIEILNRALLKAYRSVSKKVEELQNQGLDEDEEDNYLRKYVDEMSEYLDMKLVLDREKTLLESTDNKIGGNTL